MPHVETAWRRAIFSNPFFKGEEARDSAMVTTGGPTDTNPEMKAARLG